MRMEWSCICCIFLILEFVQTNWNNIQDCWAKMDAIKVIYVINSIVLDIRHSSSMIIENHERSKLKTIPENLNRNVEYINLAINRIQNISKTSLANYPNLTKLDLGKNDLRYIHDGAFDHTPKLKILNLASNMLRYIPTNFGPVQNSMTEINLWNSMEAELANMNFSKFSLLKSMILGGNPLERFDASNLPKSLNFFYLTSTMLTEMPNFIPHVPNITILKLKSNRLSHIPAMPGLQKLQNFDVSFNKLETIPDLYDKPLLRVLRMENHPLCCNESLCWVRLWQRKKTTALFGIKWAVCRTPGYFAGQKLWEVDPVKMRCYKGMCVILLGISLIRYI